MGKSTDEPKCTRSAESNVGTSLNAVNFQSNAAFISLRSSYN